MTHAAFVIGTRPDTSLDEAAALAAVAAHRLPDAEAGLVGRIVLDGGDGPPVEVRDDLEFLVPKLCLEALPRVAADGRATVAFASRADALQLVREGERVQLLDGAGTALATHPMAALQTALHDCARRFTDYVGALAEQDPDWAPLHRSLRGQLPDAP